MINRNNFDLSSYFVVGPENTKNRPVSSIIKSAINSGFTFIQIRSKVASAKELIDLTVEVSNIIENLNLSNKVTLVVNDRLDIILAAREMGAKVDGIHVGQEDIPVHICREYLGPESIIGLSTRTEDLFEYIKTTDISEIDYFGIGPLHETMTKPDCGLDSKGEVITRDFSEISKLVDISPIPIVIGGGVKLKDIENLAKTGADGFFVVSAVSESEDPQKSALKLVDTWNKYKP